VTRNDGPQTSPTPGAPSIATSRPRALADALRERITDGTWPVGARIPTEPELATLHGVGRNAVREAVQSLVHAGLLVKRQGSGTYVISDDELGHALSRHVERSAHQDALEVRRALEVEAARLAAAHRSPRDVATLRFLSAARRGAFASRDVEAMVSTDLALHRAVVATGRNALLLALYESLVDAISATIRTNVTQAELSATSHDDLVEAIADGDPAAATEAITRTLDAYLAAGAAD